MVVVAAGVAWRASRRLDIPAYANDNSSCPASRSELIRAAYAGANDEVTRRLDRDDNVDETDGAGHTALYCAVVAHRVDTLPLLVEAGADPNRASRNNQGNAMDLPLNEAIRSRWFTVADILLAHGADPNGRVVDSPDPPDIPIMIPIDEKWVDGVVYLLDHGADVNSSSRGDSALGRAVRAVRKDKPDLTTVTRLLDRGADPNLAGGRPCLDLEFLSKSSPPRPGCDAAVSVAAQANNGTLNLLLDRGGNPTLGIYEAALGNDLQRVRTLLDRGANPNGVCTPGSSPLMAAVVLGHSDVVHALLEHGADPDRGGGADAETIRSGVGFTLIDQQRTLGTIAPELSGRATNLPPLVAAAGLGEKDLVEVLLRFGADPAAAADFPRPFAAADIARKLEDGGVLALLDGTESLRPEKPLPARAAHACPSGSGG